MWPGNYRRPSSWNATTVTGAAALFTLLQVMRRRRHERDLRQVAAQGGMGVVATMAYRALQDIEYADGFWETAQWLLATYGAYEAYQLVLFNIDALKLAGLSGGGDIDYDFYTRPNSRLAMGSGYWREEGTVASWKSPTHSLMGISGLSELKPLLYVMSAALLFERLKLRQTLNKAPLQALGLYALAKEKPAERRF